MAAIDSERSDIVESLAKARFFLRHTARDLTDAQARERTTASELTVGGLIKHVTATEDQWRRFVTEGPSAMGSHDDPAAIERWSNAFGLLDGETLSGVLDSYARCAAETDDLVRTLPDLGTAQPLPPAPWFQPGAAWTARRVFLHIVAETAQHAGHADIIRESLDGAKSMG